MNKQEAIERIESGAFTVEDTDLVVRLSYTKNIINQINEPQKVTIPKFVAEWIEYCKRDKFYALHDAYANMDEEMKYWRFIGNNSALFAKAWIDGYEVEKEKLYTVEIPNPNLSAHVVLQKTEDGLVLVTVGNAGWAEWESIKLTESEIKKDFDFLWQFAKEVEIDE